MKTLIPDPVTGQKYEKTVPTFLKVADKSQGIVEAIVSVFSNVDLGNERVMPGAFKKSLARKLPKVVWMHQWWTTVGKTLEAEELLPGDPRLPESLKALGGLWVKGQFNLETQRGKEAFSDLEFGAVDEFSIGYRIAAWSRSASDDVLNLDELDLDEWSPVLVGMNQATALLGVKDLTRADAAKHLLTDEQVRKQFIEGQLAMSLDDHSSLASDVFGGWISRLERMKTDGKTISDPVLESVKSHLARLAAIEPDPSPTQDSNDQKAIRAEIDREFLKTMRTSAGV